jgi:hypothetical protein
MRRYLYSAGDPKCSTVVAALNKLGAYPRPGTRINCDARMNGWLDSAQAGFDPGEYDPSQPPPMGWSAYHSACWREPDDAPGSVELLTHLETETLLFDGTGAARLTPTERALLHRETPGRGAFRLSFKPGNFGNIGG